MAEAQVKTSKRVHTPSVVQMEAVECGAASLAMILEYHGKVVPLEELREACGVSRDGVKASSMIKAGRRYGLESKGYRMEPQKLDSLKTPLIVHWNFNHFLVLEGVSGKYVYLNDPASGRRRVTLPEFDGAFTGVVLEFKPGPEFQAGGAKRSLLQSLKNRFQDPLALLMVVLAGLFLVLPGLATPVFTKVFIDNILILEMDGWFRPLLTGMILAALLKALLTWLQKYYLLLYEARISITESGKYFHWLLRLPIVFFAQRMAGDLGKRVKNNDRVAQLLTGRLASVTLSMISAGFYLGLMVWYDLTLTLVCLVLSLVNIVVLKAVAPKREEQNLRLMMESGKLYGTGASGLELIETLKATGSESDFFGKWSGYHARLLNTSQQLGRLNYLVGVLPAFLVHLQTTLILVLGASRVIDGLMTVGMLVAFQSLMRSFTQPFNDLVKLGSDLQEATGLMIQLDDVYRTERDVCFNEDIQQGQQPVKLSGALALKGVSFGYNLLENALIEGFDLHLEPGKRVALVGRSGSGKSTIAKLVGGIYQPWSGAILFDGKSRSAQARETLVNSVAIVDQDIALFQGNIRENLTMWDPTIPDSRLIQAARDAHIYNEINARPGGFASEVDEGGRNFSGGQRQRLEIARALVLDPSILVLDEATSALDPQTEQIIDNNLRRRGCTCLIVAHRLSTVRDCDEIIVMERGKIAQRGTHQQLMEEGGHYADLVKTM